MGREQHTWRMLRLTGRALRPCMHCGETHEYLVRRGRGGICQPVVFSPGVVSGTWHGDEVEVFYAGPMPSATEEGDTAYHRLARRVAELAIRCERCGERFTNLDAYADHPCGLRSR